jgi:hypothetical protein
MTIKTISRFEFEQLLAYHPALESLMVQQVEWFSSKSGKLLGVIAKDEGVAGWNYALFKRDKNGDFHVQKVMDNFFNLSATRVDLFLSMTEIPAQIPGVRGSVPKLTQKEESHDAFGECAMQQTATRGE